MQVVFIEHNLRYARAIYWLVLRGSVPLIVLLGRLFEEIQAAFKSKNKLLLTQPSSS